MLSGKETPIFWGNLLSPYFLFRSEDVVGNSGSRTCETIIVSMTADTFDCLAFCSAISNKKVTFHVNVLLPCLFVV